ncbi:MAG TPA: DUF2017 family protein [Actinomycetota bacterium]|nr:DUF2017 family protein [Actinomycetota bacterium]
MKLIHGDGIVLAFEGYEAQLLDDLTGELKRLLSADLPKLEPVTARLFPDAYETLEDERAFRDLVGNDLRSAKLEAVETVRDHLSDGDQTRALSEANIDAWLRVLTDIRLAIGTRLDVTDETMEQDPDPDDPDGPALSVLHWLGWVQGMMLDALNNQSGNPQTDEERQ